MRDSKIEWTHHTFNPWWGCVKVSPACDHCYAEALAKRVGFSETGSKFAIWGQGAQRRFFGDDHWREPIRWNHAAELAGERRRVFCASMADIMELRPDLCVPRARLWDLIERTPALDWMLLTKRPQNYKKLLPARWENRIPRHVWLGTTVESAAYLWRIREILSLPQFYDFTVPLAPERQPIAWISAEPLLGSLDLMRVRYRDDDVEYEWDVLRGSHQVVNSDSADAVVDTPRLSLVIAGGESGGGARPSHPAWFRSLRNECLASGVPFFFKQWGEWMPSFQGINPSRNDPKCWIHDGFTFPKKDGEQIGQHMWRVGKKGAGAMLDGREWRQMPEVRV